MDFLFGGANPKPIMEDQCIMGESGTPLIAAKIHRKGRSTTLGWRAAKVRCGYALDGGLQDVLESLRIASRLNNDKTIHVDPEIIKNKDIVGAIKVAFPNTKIVSTNDEPPREGNIWVKIPTKKDEITKLLSEAPTRTATYYWMAADLDSDPESNNSWWN